MRSAEAEELRISQEWHHSGKFATPTSVYYRPQVEAFWKVVDAAALSTSDLLAAAASFGLSKESPAGMVWLSAVREAETVRQQITGEDDGSD